MSREELVQYKENLLNIRKEYTKALIDGSTCNEIKIVPSDEYQTNLEISYQEAFAPGNAENEAINYFEFKLREIIRNAVSKNVEFEGISSPLIISFFVSRKIADEINDNCFISTEKFDESEVLNGMVEVSFNFEFINDKNNVLSAENYLNNTGEIYCKNFVVNYKRFVDSLISRGYEVNNENFALALSSAIKGKETIITVKLPEKSKINK